MTRVGRAAVGVAGLAAVGFAAVLVVAPERVDGVLPVGALAEALPLSEARLRAAVFGLVGALCGLWVAWTAGPDRTRTLTETRFAEPDATFGALREDPPEHATAVRTVGATFDRRLERTANAATDGRGEDEVRSEVRSLAVDVVAEVEGCATDEARERVDTGAWTDDEVAAAYVADREASLPLRRRLLAWLRPWRTTVNRVERSISAVEARMETDVDATPGAEGAD